MAADEIERLHKIIKMMIYAAEKWDTMHIDAEGKTHYSGIGKEISNELKAIAKKDNARFLDDA
jgi:hypothetical protein